VVIDPGHSSVMPQGSEPIGPGSSEMKAADAIGTHGTTTGKTEYELTLEVSLKLKTALEAEGYTVILTRSDNNTAISCASRAAVANDNGADAFVRIHADGSTSSSSAGAMAICITPSNPYHSEMYSLSRTLSDQIISAYCAATGLSSRGVWETDTMSGNNWSQVPTTLLEMGFMTNPTEDQFMASAEGQEKIVQGIVNGLNNYFAAIG